MKFRTIIIIDSEPELKHYEGIITNPTEENIIQYEREYFDGKWGIKDIESLIIGGVPHKINTTVERIEERKE